MKIEGKIEKLTINNALIYENYNYCKQIFFIQINNYCEQKIVVSFKFKIIYNYYKRFLKNHRSN